tara:strand:- start:285 stop:1274 length:990 start_codon:yes stop_codon:yes gene_type:complete
MQSDTFINDTSSDDEDNSSDSSGDLPKNNNIGVLYGFPKEAIDGKRFMDQSDISSYDKVRRNLFSKQIMKDILFIDSNNYNITAEFNSSNYVATFPPIKNVIGIHLKSANIRVPQYNVNSTNNILKFNTDGGSIQTITINPGYYTVTELVTAFTTSTSTKSQRVDSTVITLTYYDANSTVEANKTGLKFKLVHSSAIKILWNHNNITKGAARLLGFNPIESDSFATDHHSDKPPDFSQHYVDICIPEIPGIACKRIIEGGGEKYIIDRIPLTNSTGSYQWYEPDIFVTNYFTPIKLDKLNIQLFSELGEEFDSNNSENSFELEFTCLCA